MIRQVLAEPCGLAPLSGPDADEVFRALRDEATLCEPSTDGDGALVHRPNVRALMLGAITRDRPAAARAIHEAAVRFYRLAPPGPGDHVARREELYHRLMLKEPARELDPRWTPSVADELAAVMDEMPAESRLYLAAKVKGLRLDPEVRAEADDQRWRHSVRPSAESLLERGQSREALELLRERRGHDGRVLLPDLEIEALERLDRVDEALALAEAERRRASGLGHDARIRDLVTRQARILERTGRLERAWELLDGLARLDRSAARRRGAVLDDDVRPRELVVLTGLLRIARHSGRIDRGVVEELRAETVALAEATPARLLRRGPSLVRDLAAEIGDRSQWILRLATAVRGFDVDPGGLPPREPVAGDTVAYDGFVSEADKSQGYR
nr:hypothetical protein GCM10020092_046190 [Actinoplanes digitatis]